MGFLRVLLAFSVLLEHIGVFPLTNGKFVGGVVAVQGFFIISGFYMALVLNEKYKEPKSFYINRLLRLYPTYWIVLVMTILATLLFGNELFLKNILNADWSVGSKLLMIISNLFIVGSDWMMFLYPGENGLQFTSNFLQAPIKLYSYHMLPQAWTLPLEMMFYAIAPLIIKNKKMLLTIVAVSLICRYVVSTFIGTNDPWNYRFFPSELIFFTIGALSYYSYTTISRFKYSFSIGVAFFIFITLYIINFDNIPVFLWNSMVFTGQHLQFYILLAFSIPFIFLITKSNSFDRYIGELSYPIYISHILVISLVSHLPKITYSVVYNVIIYTLVISFVINHFLQNPIERIFKRKAQMLNKPNLDSLNLSNSIIK
jgi:peptidoglycan/LPS O-acetylase OafA/YrhL